MSGDANQAWISSKELLKKSGISRATLNNYIKLGIIPKPVVQKPRDVMKGTKRIGYFLQEVLGCIETVNRLKKEGNSMRSIAQILKKRKVTESVSEGNSGIFEESFSKFPSNDSKVINDLLQQRVPTLVHFCVFVANLQDSIRICAELPPEEYFELVNQMHKTIGECFKKYYGIYGKYIGAMVVCYFLKERDLNYLVNAICCALKVKEKMKRLSAEWKAYKKWDNELYLNIGINEGEEYFGAIHASNSIEFTALGDTINCASTLSDLASYGSILITKNVINKLREENHCKFRFGVKRKIQGREIFIENLFSRVVDLVNTDNPKYARFMDIAALPVTEIEGLTNS